MEFDKEQLDTALHCQLVVGSYQAPDLCKCQSPDQCPFSREQIFALRDIPRLAEENNRRFEKWLTES